MKVAIQDFVLDIVAGPEHDIGNYLVPNLPTLDRVSRTPRTLALTHLGKVAQDFNAPASQLLALFNKAGVQPNLMGAAGSI